MKHIEALKSDILSPRPGGYVVPVGFLDEPFSTDLHVALRELRSEGLIRPGPDPGAGHESWIGD